MSAVVRLLFRAVFVWAVAIGDAILTLLGRPTPPRRDVGSPRTFGDA